MYRFSGTTRPDRTAAARPVITNPIQGRPERDTGLCRWQLPHNSRLDATYKDGLFRSRIVRHRREVMRLEMWATNGELQVQLRVAPDGHVSELTGAHAWGQFLSDTAFRDAHGTYSDAFDRFADFVIAFGDTAGETIAHSLSRGTDYLPEPADGTCPGLHRLDGVAVGVLVTSSPWAQDLARTGMRLPRSGWEQLDSSGPTAAGTTVQQKVGALIGRTGRRVLREALTTLSDGPDQSVGVLSALGRAAGGVSDDVISDVLSTIRTKPLLATSLDDPDVDATLQWLKGELPACSPARQRRFLAELFLFVQGEQPQGAVNRIASIRRRLQAVDTPLPEGVLSNWRNVEEMFVGLAHIVADARRRQDERRTQRLLPVHESVAKIDGMATKMGTIRVARSGDDLISWGSDMNNCLGSMINYANDNCVFIAVEGTDHRYEAAGQLMWQPGDRWSIEELLAPHNESLDVWAWDEIRNALSMAGV